MPLKFSNGFGAAVDLEFFVAAADVAADGMDGDGEVAIRARRQRLADLADLAGLPGYFFIFISISVTKKKNVLELKESPKDRLCRPPEKKKKIFISLLRVRQTLLLSSCDNNKNRKGEHTIIIKCYTISVPVEDRGNEGKQVKKHCYLYFYIIIIILVIKVKCYPTRFGQPLGINNR